MDQGRLGVAIFFVLSGYLITTLLLREADRQPIHLGRFFARRAIRIIPAAYFYLICLIILHAFGALPITYHNISCAATFIYNYHYFVVPEGVSHLAEMKYFVGHYWTLAVEEQFYLLWPLALVLSGRRWSPILLAGVLVACITSRLALYMLIPSVRPGLSVSLIGVADPLLIGCLLAFAEAQDQYRRWLDRVTRILHPAGLLILLIVADRTASEHLRFRWSLSFGNVAQCLMIAIMIHGIVSRPESRATRFLEMPVMRYIGTRSYSIYIWQQLFLTPLNATVSGTFPVNCVATLAAAEFSYTFIEQPFLRLKGRFAAADRSQSDGSKLLVTNTPGDRTE